jgi:hypothetical protein
MGDLTHVTQFFTRCRLLWRQAGFDLRHDLPPGDVSPDPSSGNTAAFPTGRLLSQAWSNPIADLLME